MPNNQHITPVRVIIVVTRLNIGGIPLHVSLLASRLDPAKYRTTLVYGREAPGEASMSDIAETLGAKTIFVPTLGRAISPIDDLLTFWRLFWLFRRQRPHIVHTHIAKAGFIGRLAARLAGVPVVVHTFHGNLFHDLFSPPVSNLFQTLERFAARLSDCVVTLSPHLKEDLVRFHIALADKIEVIPLGFDLQPYLAAKNERRKFRISLGSSNTYPIVGLIGRLAPQKNPGIFLQVAKLLCNLGQKVKFVVVGDGELRASLEYETQTLGLTKQITFIGWQRDMPAVYAGIDLLVLTSVFEGTPVTLIEAMASGCPVVATRVGGVPDVVQDGISGRLVESGDVEGLARAIREALTNRAETQRMAEAARADVSKRYTVEALIRNTEALYDRLLREKGLI